MENELNPEVVRSEIAGGWRFARALIVGFAAFVGGFAALDVANRPRAEAEALPEVPSVAGSLLPGLGPVEQTGAVDPWSVPQADLDAASAAYLTTVGSDPRVKMAAGLKVAVDKLRTRVEATGPAKPSPVILVPTIERDPTTGAVLPVTTTNQTIDLSKFDTVEIPIGPGPIKFKQVGFATEETPKTPRIETYLRSYFGAVDLTGADPASAVAPAK